MNNKISLTWLGQSGYLLEGEDTVIASDLYLSNFCRKKSNLDHKRLTPIPVAPERLDFIDYYLITHSHIDHFDPETIGPILQTNTNTKFFCPPACYTMVNEYFSSENKRFKLINSSIEYLLSNTIKLIAIPAAHEELEKDNNGEYICFSYLILFVQSRKAIFMGGDTIPYGDHVEMIKRHIPNDYALTMLLPVNGRDNKRAKLGFKGNLTVAEAISLANDCSAVYLIPGHYGMFALNNIPKAINPELFKAFNGHTLILEINNKVLL